MLSVTSTADPVPHNDLPRAVTTAVARSATIVEAGAKHEDVDQPQHASPGREKPEEHDSEHRDEYAP
eukprot:COSAG03_NODE_18203_length_360_cov_0.436782_1_plen_66_part_10